VQDNSNSDALEAALLDAERGDLSSYLAYVRSLIPPQYHERSAALDSVLLKNSGRPKVNRDAYGATPRLKELADTYELYWNGIDSNVPHPNAERLARKHCVITDTEFTKLIYNRNTPVNEITRRRGTFHECPTKRFLEASKN
jgi:hypothetical protein